MMTLDNTGIKDRLAWEEQGYQLPCFDREKVTAATMENPFWVHFGAGNLFRAFQANVVQRLLNDGVLDRGLVVVEGFDHEIIEKIYAPHDHLSILVTLKADGSVEKTVVGSIVEALGQGPGPEHMASFERLKEIFAKDSLQMVSFTITEKGYSLVDGRGAVLPSVAADFEAGPQAAVSSIGKVTALLYARYQSGKKPIALVSMDNCSHNGDKLRDAVYAFARQWTQHHLVEEGFWEYVQSKDKVAFPWTMIDKITPRPDASVEEMLKKDGIAGLEPVITTKNTYVAPFVNAEECEYLVIEDAFPNGRQALDKGGLIFTERETVDKVEKMKVCTCLNPLHTTLAIFGCLLGYQKISEEMQDTALRKLVEKIGYEEGLPVVTDPVILNPRAFLDTVLNVRIPNPFMPDTPQRIATDTSQKLAIRFGETIKAYHASAQHQVSDLKMIPLVFAGWLRYLMAVDDMGASFALSPDPMLETLRPHVAGIRLGETADVEAQIRPILQNKAIFGVDLYEVGMAKTVCNDFQQMIAGTGAVRAVLNRISE